MKVAVPTVKVFTCPSLQQQHGRKASLKGMHSAVSCTTCQTPGLLVGVGSSPEAKLFPRQCSARAVCCCRDVGTSTASCGCSRLLQWNASCRRMHVWCGWCGGAGAANALWWLIRQWSYMEIVLDRCSPPNSGCLLAEAGWSATLS